jgi:hypothetical protein
MAAAFFLCGYLTVAVIYALVVKLPSNLLTRAKSFSASMLSPMGTLLALFVVFTAAQVWNDNDQATAAVAREASALRSVLILATTFPGDVRGRLETLVHAHIEEVATNEWPMMARQTATLEIASRNLVEALQLTLSIVPSNPGQGIAQREMAVALESALDARRQRILISHSSVSSLKWVCLVIEAICVLIAIALCHRDQPTAAVVAMGLFATGVAACFLLIGAYDRPFVGQLAVTPSPLLQVMPEAARPIPSEASRPPNR